MDGWTLRRLARVAGACALCWGLAAPGGPQARGATPHLRPVALVHLNLPGLRLYNGNGLYPFDGQDGWVASVQQQVRAPHRYLFVVQRAGTTQMRAYPLRHATPPNFVGLVAADRRWFVWIQQSAGANGGPRDWQLIAHDMRTGREWVVDSARAEGAPDASCEFNIGGDVLVWTSSNRLLLRSRVYVMDLATRRRTVLATTRSPLFYEWPATDGRHVAWTFSRYLSRSATVSSTVQLYDLARRAARPLHIQGQASQPVLGYGAIAWVAGPSAGDGAAIGAEDLATGHRYTVPIRGTTRLSIGPCTVGFTGGGGYGIWDYCTRRYTLLDQPSAYEWNNFRFSWPMLVGRYVYMDALREIGGYNGYADPNGVYTAVFRLSADHPLRDFYH